MRYTPCLRLPPGLACRTGEMFPVRQFREFTVLPVLILSAVFAPSGAGPPKGGSAVAMKLSSTAFEPGASVPKKFTCDGADVSPALAWSDAPAGTQSFALIADDPDAPVGTWVHWVLYDLPGAARDLPEGVATQEQLANGARQGRNDFGKIGYGGPSPPPGSAHRCFFKLYALDAKLNLKPGAPKSAGQRAMKGPIPVQAAPIARYPRQG